MTASRWPFRCQRAAEPDRDAATPAYVDHSDRAGAVGIPGVPRSPARQSHGRAGMSVWCISLLEGCERIAFIGISIRRRSVLHRPERPR